MKIGVFDSGLGGLIILKSLREKFPQYDFIYLGDTKNLPYGDKTQNQIFNLTKKGVEYLFNKDCNLVLVMCNTASSKALRKLQQQWLPKHFPDRRILGPIIPTVESVVSMGTIAKVGVLATKATVSSKVYIKEFRKLNPKIKVFQKSAPKLVPLLESGRTSEAQVALDSYIKALLSKQIDTLILTGSTHYTLLKTFVKKKYGSIIKVISQDEIIPRSLDKYFKRHKEISTQLSKGSSVVIFVTKLNNSYGVLTKLWFGNSIKPRELSEY